MIFTTLAIIIASLGLYGLSTYTAQKRIKEIGVRKAIGASGGEITALLSYDFLKLITIGYFIAVTVSYFVMNRWLDNFAFHITPHWKIFVVAGGGTFLIAIVSICVQVVRSGQINPVDALRTE
jgi:putative ABC transport system permease protein